MPRKKTPMMPPRPSTAADEGSDTGARFAEDDGADDGADNGAAIATDEDVLEVFVVSVKDVARGI